MWLLREINTCSSFGSLKQAPGRGGVPPPWSAAAPDTRNGTSAILGLCNMRLFAAVDLPKVMFYPLQVASRQDGLPPPQKLVLFSIPTGMFHQACTVNPSQHASNVESAKLNQTSPPCLPHIYRPVCCLRPGRRLIAAAAAPLLAAQPFPRQLPPAAPQRRLQRPPPGHATTRRPATTVRNKLRVWRIH